MTLILVTSVHDELYVLADTEFGQAGKTGSQVGPKVFLIPIQAIDLDGANTRTFPSMGFAFAGNVLSGQFTHSLASTCLQNLVGGTTKEDVQVGDVAAVYAKAAEQIVLERWRHAKLSGYGFEGVIFGRSSGGLTGAFRLDVGIDDGEAHALVEEMDFSKTKMHPIGSGASSARARIDSLVKAGIPLRPVEIMDYVIDDPEVLSVSGTVQLAVTTKNGVELRPIIRHRSDRAGEFLLLGVNILSLGMVGSYIPIGTPISVDAPFEHVSDFEVHG
ncbi:hypothetical protein [Rhizobium leguminosarum]|uniref:hypothetical protein n=1 Tax=Rhizobium leguminosarum TaxID=384 RepID=UPI00103BFEDF|nr:hypothetical protein [Rhizobium leguminosarum]MBY5461839.1 hypothetical protein [Rhizobium leguminosarum]TCA42874.1 hypothetical protein E0H72_15700 [Rhizobium leguminosarum bv. viciae]